jgi:integrase
VAFKSHLNEQRNPRSNKPLSASTKHTTLGALKAFFLWLADQPGYRSAVSYSDAEYFNASEHDRAVASAKREQVAPTPEQILRVLRSMPTTTEIDLRNRALVAFVFLTGMRDGAVASTKLKHVDLADGSVFQDARDMRTKFSKTFRTWFFPVGDEVRQIVEDWVQYLREQAAWGQDDPLFPATQIARGSSTKFEASGLAREHWSSASPIRQIFRTAFEGAGLSYFNPHSFRKTLALLGEQLCHGPEEFKAWSQNIGHEDVMTTLRSYGEVPSRRQAEIIRHLAEPAIERDVVLDDVMRSIEKLRRS